ncbi:TetR/AcrR family transcriptional regulator [Methylobacterium sp. E-065]|uniref:TetR/AcrR family transcriptional regulator n=1 Tax=Methylobacterium sp. E-065 TaxID=2836583 RepID=UPI001FBB3803|nr:TetR/AcrR family transcriptional regulator [Methylobacterium sp. E-065]MCJ2015924.1 TetR/AcrR family transcriptional regulator [Methylobacterium sp. E-065]
MTINDAKPQRRLGRPPRGTEGEVTLRILDAATQVFLSESFDAVSIDDIASAACISKKTFYTRFASKGDLFEAFAVRFIEERIQPVEQIDLEKMSTAEALHDIAAGILRTVLCPDVVALQRNVMAEAIRFPELARSLEDFGQSRIAAIVERCLEEGVRRGEIQVKDIRFAASYFVTAMVRGPFHRATIGLERPEFSHVKHDNLKRALDLFLSGCLPR